MKKRRTPESTKKQIFGLSLSASMIVTLALTGGSCKQSSKSDSGSNVKGIIDDVREFTVPASVNIGKSLNLGRGYSEMRQFSEANTCIGPKNSGQAYAVYEKNGGDVKFFSDEATKKDSIYNKLGITVDSKFGMATEETTPISGTVKYVDENMSTDNTWSYYEGWSYSPGNIHLNTNNLTVLDQFQDSEDPNRSTNTRDNAYYCGNRYLQQIDYVAHGFVNVKITFRDKKQKDTFTGSATMNKIINGIKVDGTLKGDYDKTHLQGASKITFESVQVGGDAESRLNRVPLDCSVGTAGDGSVDIEGFKACMTEARKYVNSAKAFYDGLKARQTSVDNIQDFFVPSEYTMAKYDKHADIKRLHPVDYSSRINNKFRNIFEIKERYSRELSRINQLLAKGWAQDNRDFNDCFRNLKKIVSNNHTIFDNVCTGESNCDNPLNDSQQIDFDIAKCAVTAGDSYVSERTKILSGYERLLQVPEFEWSFPVIDDVVEVWMKNSNDEDIKENWYIETSDKLGTMKLLMNKYWDGKSPYLQVDIYLKNKGMSNQARLKLEVAKIRANGSKDVKTPINFEKYIMMGNAGRWRTKIHFFKGKQDPAHSF